MWGSIINLLVPLVILGTALYLIDQIPMPAWIKTVINVISVLAVFLWILSIFGLYHFRAFR